MVDELAVRAAGRGGPAVRVLARRAPSSRVAAVGHVRADLTRPETLRGALAGVEVLVHTAAYVGRDPARCEAVNHRGTLALLDEARRAGVEHVVYVSTASVYGPGPHRGADEQALVPRPASPASMSRLRAERAVLDAGGTVLRPHLVYGVGDEWFIPGLAGLLSGVSVWPAGQVSRSSVIAVRDLARGVAGLACGPSAADRSTVYHAAHPGRWRRTSSCRRFGGVWGFRCAAGRCQRGSIATSSGTPYLNSPTISTPCLRWIIGIARIVCGRGSVRVRGRVLRFVLPRWRSGMRRVSPAGVWPRCGGGPRGWRAGWCGGLSCGGGGFIGSGRLCRCGV
ncbi:NAD-dependent epimerase/dehydratase family protein [Streptomyces albogriseolus]